jgi:hypothetical protein
MDNLFKFSMEIAQKWTLTEFNKLPLEKEMNFLNARLMINKREDWIDSELFTLLGHLVLVTGTENALDSLNFQLAK